jgi:hypothetical protein
VVFTLPLGNGGVSQLMSLPASRVDWPRTENSSDNLRAVVRYADVRGELDFSALAGDVAGVLNEIAFTKDPGRRLQLALQARRRLERGRASTTTTAPPMSRRSCSWWTKPSPRCGRPPVSRSST